MRPDFNSTQKLSPQHQYQSQQHQILPIGGGHGLQVAELVDEGIAHYSPTNLNNLAQVTEILSGERQPTRKPRKPSTTIWRLVLMLGDGVLFITCLSLVLVLHLNLGIRPWNDELGTWDSKLVWSCLCLSLWSITASIMRAQEMDNLSHRFRSPVNALFALILMLVVCTLLLYPFAEDKLAYISSLVFFLVLTAPTLCIWRIVLAGIIGLPRFRRKAVIVGVNTAGEAIVRELRSAKRPGIQVLGCISERSSEYLEKDSLPILGDRTTLQYLAKSGMIDMIVIAVDSKESYELFQEAINLAHLGISVVPIAVVYESVCGQIPIEHIDDQWYVALPSTGTISPFYLCLRKVIDITFALFGSMVLLLILPILALLIWLDSPGPIFYTQERLGFQGKKFSMIKLRSMQIDAEYAGHAKWATKEDPRVTRIGRFLRSTHLDELPQVLNILHGDMSLIGPRPERQEFVRKLEESIPFYRYRLSITPGLTGWAQVKYHYGGTDHAALEKLQYDLYYIKHRSITLDIFIILKTVAEVLLRRGT